MRQGNLQISQRPVAESRPVRTVSVRAGGHDEDTDSLILTVVQRRWKLLALSTLLSAALATYAYHKHTLPKSITTGQLKLRAMPYSPNTQSIRQSTLTIKELLRSNECLSAIRKKHTLGMPVKQLREAFAIEASRFQDYITVEFTWSNGQTGIDVVNDLMQMTCDLVASDRKATLQKWTEVKDYEIADLDVEIEK
ncbi:MAG: hypothetical protein KDB27_24130, partial [Planctomycetales bacterium]|nr:hypothetical protein [Planctomycetales bacterium]